MNNKLLLKDFCTLIRWKNLVIILLTQFIVKYFVIGSYNVERSIGQGNSFFVFSCLCLCTLIIAASGYLINNIYDTTTDLINKSSALVIKTNANKSNLMYVYYIMIFFALIIGILPSVKSNHFYYYFIFPFCISILFLYAKYFKSTVLIGNILVSFLTALSIFILVLFENNNYDFIDLNLYYIIIMYSGFAFCVSLIREIVKDMEDIEGDFKADIITIATKYGLEVSKKIAIGIGFLTLILLWISFHPLNENYINQYFFYAIIISLESVGLFIIYHLYKSKTKKDYSNNSKFIKIWMIIGILSMCLIPKLYH